MSGSAGSVKTCKVSMKTQWCLEAEFIHKPKYLKSLHVLGLISCPSESLHVWDAYMNERNDKVYKDADRFIFMISEMK